MPRPATGLSRMSFPIVKFLKNNALKKILHLFKNRYFEVRESLHSNVSIEMLNVKIKLNIFTHPAY